MQLYDSLSRKKKPLPHTGKKPLRLFVCGPTVYDYAHLGHARTYLVFDILVRALRASGHRVFYLQNITNVDNKIITRAQREKKGPLVLARAFEKEYLKDMRALGVTTVNRYARASDFIPQIVRQIQTLTRKGYAYRAPDGYYFNIAKFARYGKLAGRTAAQAEDSVSRIDEGVQKINRGDFVLWKFVKTQMKVNERKYKKYPLKIVDGEPAWGTPLGWGRPGWHIEDTAISEAFFGPQYDIHGGGMDLKFPHHESEIAQQEAASGKRPFVKIWMHAGTLLVEGKKMAKSDGNFITLRDFLNAHSPAALRWLVLQHHYRSPINYTSTLLASAEQAMEKLFEKIAAFKMAKKIEDRGLRTKDKKQTEKYLKRFNAALDNDLNTPQALAILWETANDACLSPRAKLSLLFSYDEVLGLGLKNTKKQAAVPAPILELVHARELCRSNKQFAHADALRERIEGLGYRVEDTSSGPKVLRVK